jgi:hypothetical protein
VAQPALAVGRFGVHIVGYENHHHRV